MNSFKWPAKLEDLAKGHVPCICTIQSKRGPLTGRDKVLQPVGGDRDAPGLKGTNEAWKSSHAQAQRPHHWYTWSAQGWDEK